MLPQVIRIRVLKCECHTHYTESWYRESYSYSRTCIFVSKPNRNPLSQLSKQTQPEPFFNTNPDRFFSNALCPDTTPPCQVPSKTCKVRFEACKVRFTKGRDVCLLSSNSHTYHSSSLLLGAFIIYVLKFVWIMSEGSFVSIGLTKLVLILKIYYHYPVQFSNLVPCCNFFFRFISCIPVFDYVHSRCSMKWHKVPFFNFSGQFGKNSGWRELYQRIG